METLGKRFEEARKKKGVSLREAAEATKLRTDYLASFENDEFKISVPEIYVRGFVKLYARYLGMDQGEALRDIQVVLNRQFGTGRQQRPGEPRGERFADDEVPGGHPSLGRIPGSKTEVRRQADPPREPVDPPPQLGQRETEFEDDDSGRAADKAMYIKIGAGVVGILVLALLLINLIGMIFTGTGDREDRDRDRATILGEETYVPGPDSLIIRASDRTEVILYPQGQRGRENILWRGILTPEESFEREVPEDVDIAASAVENLEIERRGDRIRTSGRGPGRLSVDG